MNYKKFQETDLSRALAKLTANSRYYSQETAIPLLPLSDRLFYLSMSCITLALVVAIIGGVAEFRGVSHDIANWAVLVGQSFSLLQQIIIIISGIFVIRKGALGPLQYMVEDIEQDLDDVALFSSFDEKTINTAIERIELEIKNLRSKVSSLCGAIDKIGIIPSLLGWVVSYVNIKEKPDGNFLYMAGVAILFCYIVWSYGDFVARRLENTLCILKIAAINLKLGPGRPEGNDLI
jgi:hypothetical protein